MDLTVLLIYIPLVWIISILLTVYDKSAAKRRGQRIPERILLLFGAIGGAGGMLITMRAIRHKTRKPKFMITLPLLLVLHILLLVFYFKWRTGQIF